MWVTRTKPCFYITGLTLSCVMSIVTLYSEDKIGPKMKPPRTPRKRGRPPKGEFSDKKATLTTRITEPVRAGLDREAQRNGRSLSQEVELRLAQSLKAPKKLERAFGNKRNRAFAMLVARLIRALELSTGKSWREDPYTCEALRAGFTILMARLAPDGDVMIPERIAEDIEKNHEVFEQYKRPEGLALACAIGIFDSLLAYESPPIDYPPSTHYSDAYYEYPAIRKDLGLDGGKK